VPLLCVTAMLLTSPVRGLFAPLQPSLLASACSMHVTLAFPASTCRLKLSGKPVAQCATPLHEALLQPGG